MTLRPIRTTPLTDAGRDELAGSLPGTLAACEVVLRWASDKLSRHLRRVDVSVVGMNRDCLQSSAVAGRLWLSAADWGYLCDHGMAPPRSPLGVGHAATHAGLTLAVLVTLALGVGATTYALFWSQSCSAPVSASNIRQWLRSPRRRPLECLHSESAPPAAPKQASVVPGNRRCRRCNRNARVARRVCASSVKETGWWLAGARCEPHPRRRRYRIP